jgi:alkanesulfonate monooxygenase SsuD/methylene tetrahydromethanopterin reductase-like flavin-dependent oxidoreductase (luciferase family)
VEKALRFLAEDGARDPSLGRQRRRIVGAPEQVRAEIEAVAQSYGAEEALIVTITHDHAARRRSYELIAAAFGLGGAENLLPLGEGGREAAG